MQFDMFSMDQESKTLIDHDGTLLYYPDFFQEDLFSILNEQIIWREDEITLYGKTHPVPRLQAWYGDEGLKYSYSNIKLEPLSWPADLLKVKKEIEARLGLKFNSCLCNLYRNGKDYVSWHSDDEPELGKNPTIASVSFGQERRASFMHRFDKGIEKVSVDLETKSLLLMKGKLQHKWKHQINKTSRKVEQRINLTFRTIYQD